MNNYEMAFMLRHNALCSRSVASTVIMMSPNAQDKDRTKAMKDIKRVNKELEKLNSEIVKYYSGNKKLDNQT